METRISFETSFLIWEHTLELRNIAFNLEISQFTLKHIFGFETLSTTRKHYVQVNGGVSKLIVVFQSLK